MQIMQEVLRRRESYDRKTMPYDQEPTVGLSGVEIEGVKGYWLTPEDPSPGKLVIYLHGGGFAMGSFGTHGRMVSHFAKRLQVRILFIEYALAPEHPFPAGLNDVMKVYREMVSRYPEYQIDLIGDSAGGSLIVSAVGEMLKTGIRLPHAAVLISPWVRLECDHPSIDENAPLDVSLDRETLELFARAYTGGAPPGDSSPDKANLTEFPPVLIMVGTNEILLDDSRYFYDRVKRIQGRARLSIYEDEPHVWVKKDILKEASRRALTEIAEFLAFR
jgi:acetyl esterase/lipase